MGTATGFSCLSGAAVAKAGWFGSRRKGSGATSGWAARPRFLWRWRETGRGWSGARLRPVSIRLTSGARWLAFPHFAKRLLTEAKVAVAPGVGFGEEGEGFVRLALVENEQRLRQAARGIKKMIAGA